GGLCRTSSFTLPNINNLSDKRYFTKAYASHYATEAEGRSAVLAVNFKY
ncbi:hypothetical protein LGP23_003759, partial [Acinetobacter baumannii]|nr:hypothetical protein [Acinetobacter baumannii]